MTDHTTEKDAHRARLMDALANAPIRLWTCPIREHGERVNERGMPVVTVNWRDGVAHCTAPDCGNTSLTTSPGQVGDQ